MTIRISPNTPLLFYSLVACALLALFSLWFFLHPNSPWHSRNNYSIAFKEIGDLKVGSPVTVNGLMKGSVKGMDLTDSCVWTHVAVLANVKIPLNSKPRVTNVGLMGERSIDISLGDSPNYHANKALIIGYFDKGSTDIGILIFDILKDAEEIFGIFTEVADSLFSEEKIDEFKRIGKKGKQLGNNLSRLANSTEKSLSAIVDSLAATKDEAASLINHIKTDLNDMDKNIDLIKSNLSKLENSLSGLKTSIEKIADELESRDNTVSLIFDKSETVTIRQELKTLSDDAERLMKKISTRGLDLNVDIF